MKILFAFLLLITLAQFSNLAAQTSPNRYETEYLTNPNPGKKDTREVNAVLVFEKDSLKIYSRRKKTNYLKNLNIPKLNLSNILFQNSRLLIFQENPFW